MEDKSKDLWMVSIDEKEVPGKHSIGWEQKSSADFFFSEDYEVSEFISKLIKIGIDNHRITVKKV